MLFRPAVLMALAAIPLAAQSIRVYSEFERLDPFGTILAADRAEYPREVLSPALLRNAYASFSAAIEIPEGKEYSLFIAQNPERSVGVNVYKQCWTRRGEAWVPDVLRPLKVSDNGMVETVAKEVPGQTILLLWLDLFVAKTAPVRRTRFELQLSVDDQWIIYPFELRMTVPQAPAATEPLEALAPIDSPSGESARVVLYSYICGPGAPAARAVEPTVRDMIRRNARQDMAVFRSLESRVDRAVLVAGLVAAAGGGDPKTWCQAGPPPPSDLGSEWYLRVRNYLLQMYSLHPAPAAPGRQQ
jgi:hypothetical protein